MNYLLPVLSKSRRLRSSGLLCAGSIAFVSALLAGCGGGSGSTSVSSGTTPVTLLATSTGNDKLSELSMNITGVTLTSKDGNTVTLLNNATTVEFVHLNGNIEPLVTANVPQGSYTSASISYSGGVPNCVSLNPLNGSLTTYTGSGGGGVATSNFSQPITISGTGMGLQLDLQLSQTAAFPSCPLDGITSIALTPTFDMAPLTLTGQPTNSTNGKAAGLRGLVGSVNNNGASFIVTGDLGISSGGPTWQVNSNSSTAFQGISSAAELAAGMPVDMDVAIQADGSLLATRIGVYDINTTTLSFSSGPLLQVAASVPLIDTLAVETQGVALHGDPELIGYNLANALFQVSGQMTNLSTLPFMPAFSAANIVPGQNAFTTTHATEGGYFPLSSVTLLPQTINGTVSATSSSGNFTLYTVTLAPYDLFADLASQAGQNSLISQPNQVIVYADNNTQLLTSKPVAVGSTLRFNGMVFNDGGTLRMDCAEIKDGATE